MNAAEQHITALEAEIVRLEAKVAALRQPCSHAPQWGVAECAWCQVRTAFVRQVSPATYQPWALECFDAAVQAVREDHQ